MSVGLCLDDVTLGGDDVLEGDRDVLQGDPAGLLLRPYGSLLLGQLSKNLPSVHVHVVAVVDQTEEVVTAKMVSLKYSDVE